MPQAADSPTGPPRAGQATARGLQSDHAAIRRRPTNRPAPIASLGQWSEARGNLRSGTSARTARIMVEVPRIARDAVQRRIGRPLPLFIAAQLLEARAAEFAARLGVKNAALSLSHTVEQAIAQVILEN